MQRFLAAVSSTLALALLAACGGGSGQPGQPEPPPQQTVQPVTFALRLAAGPGGPSGTEQDFRYASTSPEFIAKARAQLALPVVGHTLVPSGLVAAGDGGVNLGWNWHFSEMDLVAPDAAASCDGELAAVQRDLARWLDKRFCPQRAFVLAELGQVWPLADLAVGETRSIEGLGLTVELRDVADSRCGSAMVCVAQIGAGGARADLLVRRSGEPAQALTIDLGSDRPGKALGHEFTFHALRPYPVTGPWPKERYRADISVRKL